MSKDMYSYITYLEDKVTKLEEKKAELLEVVEALEDINSCYRNCMYNKPKSKSFDVLHNWQKRKK